MQTDRARLWWSGDRGGDALGDDGYAEIRHSRLPSMILDATRRSSQHSLSHCTRDITSCKRSGTNARSVDWKNETCGLKERNGVRPNEKLSWLRRDGVCNCSYDCSGWGQRLHQRSGGWRRCRTRCRSPRISRRGGRLRDWSSRSLEKREEEAESEPTAI
jgi:hypothetical protein